MRQRFGHGHPVGLAQRREHEQIRSVVLLFKCVWIEIARERRRDPPASRSRMMARMRADRRWVPRQAPRARQVPVARRHRRQCRDQIFVPFAWIERRHRQQLQRGPPSDPRATGAGSVPGSMTTTRDRRHIVACEERNRGAPGHDHERGHAERAPLGRRESRRRLFIDPDVSGKRQMHQRHDAEPRSVMFDDLRYRAERKTVNHGHRAVGRFANTSPACGSCRCRRSRKALVQRLHVTRSIPSRAVRRRCGDRRCSRRFGNRGRRAPRARRISSSGAVSVRPRTRRKPRATRAA